MASAALTDDDGDSRDVIGQCDARRLPERFVRLLGCFRDHIEDESTERRYGIYLEYHLVPAGERERMIDAWTKHRPVTADDL